MPNYCSTTYKIVGDTEELKHLFDKLTTLHDISEKYQSLYVDSVRNNTPEPEKPPEIMNINTHFALGDIANYFGGDCNKIKCAGGLECFEMLSDTILQITTDTAWYDMPEVWDIVVSNYKSLKYYYTAEELGHEYFINSDRSGEYFPDKYYVYDAFRSESDYLNSDSELLKDMEYRLDIDSIANFSDLDIWLEIFNDDHPDDNINYYKFLYPAPTVPSIKAAYRVQSERLRVYQNGKCVIDDNVEDEDYWNSITVNNEVYDINLYKDDDGDYSLCLYPVYDGEVDCSVWQKIKLLVLPI